MTSPNPWAKSKARPLGIYESLPPTVYRNAWGRLVERSSGDTVRETAPGEYVVESRDTWGRRTDVPLKEGHRVEEKATEATTSRRVPAKASSGYEKFLRDGLSDLYALANACSAAEADLYADEIVKQLTKNVIEAGRSRDQYVAELEKQVRHWSVQNLSRIKTGNASEARRTEWQPVSGANGRTHIRESKGSHS